jgi:hypothetical protein
MRKLTNLERRLSPEEKRSHSLQADLHPHVNHAHAPVHSGCSSACALEGGNRIRRAAQRVDAGSTPARLIPPVTALP